MDKDIGEFGCSLACNLSRSVASGQTISSLQLRGKKVISKNKIKYYFIFLFPSTFSVHPVLLCCREQQQRGKSEQQFGSIFRETLLPQTKIYIELNGVSATYFSLLSGNCKKKRNS